MMTIFLSKLGGAEGAAAGGDGDVAEALGTFFGGGVRRHRLLLHAIHKGVHREHHEVINGGGDEQEGDDGVDEIADGELAAVDSELNGGEVGLTDQGRDERGQEVFGESGDDAAEGRTDDDADGKIDDVAAK